MEIDKLVLNILIIGSSDGGKTSFTNRWTKNTFTYKTKHTIISEFGFKMYEKNGKLIRTQLWDIASNDKKGDITKVFAEDAHGCVIVSQPDYISSREK